MEVDAPDIAGLYRRFAEYEARQSSPVYARLCDAVAEDGEILAILGALPIGKRQPNLFLGALRLLGAPVDDPAAALAFACEHVEPLTAVMLTHSTQTNEAARCAVMLPAPAQVCACSTTATRMSTSGTNGRTHGWAPACPTCVAPSKARLALPRSPLGWDSI